MPGGGSLALSGKSISNLLKHWLDAMGDGGRAISVRDEVGEAGQDDDGGLSPDLSEGLLEDPDVTAGEDLGLLQLGIGSATCLRDMGPDIRIAKKGEDSNQGRHPCWQSYYCVSKSGGRRKKIGKIHHCIMLSRLIIAK